MSSLLCSTACGELTSPPASYWDGCDGNVFRKLGYPFAAIVRCDVEIPDIKDLTAWSAAKAAGNIQLLPCGKVRTTSGFDTSSDVDDCGGDVVLETTVDVTFETYQTAKDKSDYIYWKTLLKNHSNYRLVWFDCDGCPTFNPAATESVLNSTPNVGNPGYAFTISSNPDFVEGDGGRGKWMCRHISNNKYNTVR